MSLPPRPKANRLAPLAIFTAALLCPPGALGAAGEPPPPGSSASPRAKSLEVQAYSERLGVPKAAAEKQLEVQRKGNDADIVGRLQEDLGKSFAGAWFDPESGEFVVPFAPGGDGLSESAGRATIAGGLSRASLGADYRAKPVQSSWSELEAAQAQLNDALLGAMDEGLVRTSLDPRVNAVVIHLASGAGPAQRAAIERLAAKSPVQALVREEDRERFRASLSGCDGFYRLCDRPLRGGVGISPAGGVADECTAGFRAKGDADGKWYLLTAGHCVVALPDVNQPIPHWISQDATLFESRYIGELKQRNFPNHDWAKIEASGSWWDTAPFPAQVAYWGENQPTVLNESYPINGEAASYINQLVCHSGLTTGTTCGVVEHVDQDGTKFELEGGSKITINDLVVAKGGCNKPGDSGGPWFAWNIALGMNTGNDLDYPHCGNQTRSFYTRINDATNDLGVTINPVTDAPEVETGGGVTFPAPRQASLNTSSVDPNSVATNYHFQYGTTTGYGSASQLYGAGAGSEPITVGGTLNNLKGGTTYHFRIVGENALGSDVGVDRVFTTPYWKPIITPHTPVNVKAGKASLRAQINPQGAQTHYHFEVGTQPGVYEYAVPYPSEAIGSGTSSEWVSQQIDVKGSTTYHWRVVASNEDGISVSPNQSFTTPDWRPAVTTEKQSGVKVHEEAGQATLNGKVNPKGFETTYRFEWGSGPEVEAGEFNNTLPVLDGEAGSGESDVSVSELLRPIKGQTPFHYRLVAENEEGKRVGAVKSFTTPDWRPAVSHSAAVGVGAEDATLISRINPKGFDTTYRIEWADQAEFEAGEYGHEIEGESIGSGDDVVEIAEEISGLIPRKPYHFRVVAENAEGVRISPDVLFKTSTSGFKKQGSGYPITLHGEPAGPLIESFAGFEISCTSPEFEASLEDPGVETFKGGAEILPVDLLDTIGCSNVFGNFSWEMNGCQFELDPGYGEEGSFEGEFNIGPPGCGPITTELGYCPISIPPQIGRSASFENNGEGSDRSVYVTMQATEIRYKQEGGLYCGVVEKADGQLEGTWELRGEDEAEDPVGVYVSKYFDTGPDVETKAATEVEETTATLNGVIDTFGIGAAYGFEYGTSTEYGEIASGGIITGEESGLKSLSVGGLEADTTYHFRMAAFNENGVSYGEDRTFTTTSVHGPHFQSEAFPVEISGDHFGEVLDFGGNTALSCESGQLQGESTSPSADLSLTPSYGECVLTGQGSATVSTNSCGYRLHVANSDPPYTGSVAIECTEEDDAIVINGPSCDISLPPQSGIGTVSYANQGEEAEATVKADLGLSGISYTTEGFACELAGLPAEGEDGTSDGDLSLAAFAGEEEVGLSVTGAEATMGVYVAGEESEEEAAQPRFEADEYPAVLTGAQSPVIFDFGGKTTLECESSELSGEATEAASDLSLDLAFEGDCTVSGITNEASVDTHSCGYGLHVSNTGPPYEGTMAIECASEGDAIEITATSSCTIEVPAQQLGGSVSYANQGEEAEATVKADLGLSGISYTTEGFACEVAGLPAEGEDGSSESSLTVGGRYPG